MFSPDDPSWSAYKTALARLGEASQQLEMTRATSPSRLGEAEEEFHEALAAYTAARMQLGNSPVRLCDGVRSFQAWLGAPPMVHHRGQQHQGDTTQQQQGGHGTEAG